MRSMIDSVFAVGVFETMFFAGLIDSPAGVASRFIEDGKELFGKD